MYDDREYRPVAPDIDSLVRCYDRGFSHMERNSSRELLKAMEPLFDALSDLALHKASDEAKTIWIAAPRGELSDFREFEDYEDEYIKTPEDFRNYWLEEYPDDPVWYRLTIGEGPERFPYRSVAVDNTGIANVRLNEEIPDEADYREEPALKLLPLLTKLAKESMEKLREDTYNEWVSTALPYQHRTGVIKRSDEWKAYPEERDRIWGEMDRETYEKFKTLVATNDEGSIGRIASFTAKANCGPYGRTLAYRIVDQKIEWYDEEDIQEDASLVKFIQKYSLCDDDLTISSPDDQNSQGEGKKDAAETMRELLSGGPVEMEMLKERFQEYFSERTYFSTRNTLGVKKIKIDGKTMLMLPKEPQRN